MKNVFQKSAMLFGVAVIFLTSCDATKRMNNEQKGVAVGAGAGAVIGGIIGNNVGKGSNTGIGAMIGAVVGGVAGGIIGNKMDKQAEKIKSEIPGAEVVRVGEGIDVIFSDKNPDGSKVGVYFATNKSELTENSKMALARLIKVFNEYPDTDILVEGHTDSDGTESYNMTLSQKRANAVGEYLKSAGIAASRLTIKAYGETQPRVPNTDAISKADNRRVEFIVTANAKMKADAEKEAQQQGN